MISPVKLLERCIRRLHNEDVGERHLRVFDFDDTLVKTDAKVYVTGKDGITSTLTPGEFAVYEKRRGDVFDYCDFEKLINPREIRWTMRLLRKVYAHHGANGLVVLSARSVSQPIKKFMHSAGYPDVEIVALDSANPRIKAEWISDRIFDDNIRMIEFFDDSHKNVRAVKDLKAKHPDVKIVVHHVVNVQKPKRKKRS